MGVVGYSVKQFGKQTSEAGLLILDACLDLITGHKFLLRFFKITYFIMLFSALQQFCSSQTG